MVCWGARRGRAAADSTYSAVPLVGAPGAQPGLAWLNAKYENLSEQSRALAGLVKTSAVL